MRKQLLAALLFVPLLASAQTAVPFTLKGTIGKIDPPARIYMLRDGEFTDLTTLHNGAFEIKGTLDTPKEVRLVLIPSGIKSDAFNGASGVEHTSIFLGEGTTVLTSSDSLYKAKVTGSKLAMEYNQLWTVSLKSVNNKMRALLAQYPKETEQSSEAIKPWQAQEKSVMEERNKLLIAHIKANPNSYVSLNALKQIGGFIPSYAEVGPLYDALSPAVRNSPDGRKYGALLQVIKAAVVGIQTPDDKAVEQAVEKYRAEQQVILTKERDQQRKERNQQLAAYVKANPDSYASLDAVEQIGGTVPDYAEVIPIYNALALAIRNTPAGKAYGEKLGIIKQFSVGAQAPNFTQKTPDGREVSLTDYRGKYVLIDFWASWCGPCRAENPNISKLYGEYKDRGFTILGVSLDNEKAREKWLKAIADDQLAWTQVSDLKGWQNEVATRYHIQAIPQNFLVDPSGKIIATNLRGDDLKAALAKHIR